MSVLYDPFPRKCPISHFAYKVFKVCFWPVIITGRSHASLADVQSVTLSSKLTCSILLTETSDTSRNKLPAVLCVSAVWLSNSPRTFCSHRRHPLHLSMAEVYYVGVDVGTASVRAALVTRCGVLRSTAREPITIWEPQTDHYVQSSTEIWEKCCIVVKVGCSHLSALVHGADAGLYCSWGPDWIEQLQSLHCNQTGLLWFPACWTPALWISWSVVVY